MHSPRRTSKAAAHGICLAALLGVSFAASGFAAAADNIPEPDLTAEGHLATHGPVNMLPEAVAARVNGDRAVATTWAGYDGGKHAPLMTAMAEARIVGRLVFAAGAGYTADMPSAPALRPQVGLRAQLLDQARHGVDAAVALSYRLDRFTDEEGFVQSAVALERRQGRVRVAGNLIRPGRRR